MTAVKYAFVQDPGARNFREVHLNPGVYLKESTTAAREAGAESAKLAGAGKGGTIIALATNPEPVKAALREAGAADFFLPKPVSGLTVE